MSANYFTTFTELGHQKAIQAILTESSLQFATMVIGDNLDSDTPLLTQEILKLSQVRREVYRSAILSGYNDPANPSHYIIEHALPNNVGGFWIREVALLDSEDNLLVYMFYPPEYRPTLEDGFFQRNQIIGIGIASPTADTFKIQVNEPDNYATHSWVEQAIDGITDDFTSTQDFNQAISQIDQQIEDLNNRAGQLKPFSKVDITSINSLTLDAENDAQVILVVGTATSSNTTLRFRANTSGLRLVINNVTFPTESTLELRMVDEAAVPALLKKNKEGFYTLNPEAGVVETERNLPLTVARKAGIDTYLSNNDVSNIDLNTVTEIGEYSYVGAVGVNNPIGLGVKATLKVWAIDTQFIYQMSQGADSTLFIRNRNGLNQWTPWGSYLTTAKAKVFGIDADLALTNNATGSDFDNSQFKLPGVWYFDHALNTSLPATAGVMTIQKAGNKVYQHELLDIGREANRIFDGVSWGPWTYERYGTAPTTAITAGADLDTYITEGYYEFHTTDNILNAPPSQGGEYRFEMQVILSPNTPTGTNVIQVVKNTDTNIGWVRGHYRVDNTTLYDESWIMTPPITQIVSNTHVDAILSEGVYLIDATVLGVPQTYSPRNSNKYNILIVKNSTVRDKVLQALINIGDSLLWTDSSGAQIPAPSSGQRVRFRLIDTGGLGGYSTADNATYGMYGAYGPVEGWEPTPIGPLFFDSLTLNFNAGGGWTSIIPNQNVGALRNSDLNLLPNGIRVFTVADANANTPPAFTDTDDIYCVMTVYQRQIAFSLTDYAQRYVHTSSISGGGRQAEVLYFRDLATSTTWILYDGSNANAAGMCCNQ